MVNAEYVIDIATQVSGVDHTESELDSVTKTLIGADNQAEAFESALKGVALQLKAASSASSEAAESYTTLKKEFEAVEAAALRSTRAEETAAAKLAASTEAVDKLRARLESLRTAELAIAQSEQRGTEAHVAASAAVLQQVNAVAAAEKVMMNAARAHAKHANAAVDQKAALAALVPGLDAAQAAAQAAAASENKLVATQKKLVEMQRHTSRAEAQRVSDLSKVKGALGDLGGPLARVGEGVLRPVKGFAELKEVLGGSRAAMIAGAVGLVGLTAAISATSAAALAGAAALTAWGLSLGSAARDARLASEAAYAADAGLAAMQGTIGELSEALSIPEERLMGLTRALQDAKVPGNQMAGVLSGLAAAEGALGKGGADKFVSDLKSGKTTAAELASTLEDTFGGLAAKRAIGLDKTVEKLSKNFGKLFDVPGVDKFLGVLSKMAGWLDRSHEIGASLQLVIGGGFDSIATSAEDMYFQVEGVLLDLTNAVLETYIAWKRWDSELTVTKDVMKAIGVSVLIVTAALLAIPVVLGVVLYSFYKVGEDIVKAIIWAKERLVEAFGTAAEWTAWAMQIGGYIVDGMVNGLKSGMARVWSAMSEMGAGAIAAIENVLGINSPAKELVDVGLDTTGGKELGIRKGTPKVVAAAEDMADRTLEAARPRYPGGVSDVVAQAASVAPGAAPGAAPSITITGPITFQGLPDAPTGIRQFGEMLLQVLEGDAAELGAA